YLAIATRGSGVVETLIGLMHLTWSSLDAEHDLAKKFGFDAQRFLAEIAQKLGESRDVPELLSACVGGALEVLRPEAVT
ncbi:MAG TPA: hypothetical protein VMS65_04680, partial [Polyangiaceae bacterium]|nr:hypothetical protein [Polyangiaceae bacterium]